MDSKLPDIAVAEHLADRIAAVGQLPDAVRAKCEETLIDVVGLCLAARNEDYVQAALNGWDDDGPCTAIGHKRTLSAAGAAFVNGTAAHGEDFDDTFEGGPVHAGAVLVPAVLAACERYGIDGAAALKGIAVGIETMCRLSTVAPTKAHKAGFHPTAVYGAAGAAAGVATALGLEQETDGRRARHRRLDGVGHHRISRRGHLDQAHARRLGGAIGPARRAAGARRLPGAAHRVRGHARAVPRLRQHARRRLRRADRRFRAALGDADAGLQAVSVRDHDAPVYRLRAAARHAHQGDDVAEMVCDVGEGTVHRLWEPLAAKQTPKNGYSAKFSQPYCIATGFIRGNVGLADFTDAAVKDRALLALAGKVRYRIDPDNPYPNNFTGHIRVTLARRQRGRGAPAAHAGRGARAADAGGYRGQVHAQRPARRHRFGAREGCLGYRGRHVQRTDRPVRAQRVRK